MTSRIAENCSTLLVDWSPVIMVNTMPPRDPNDDDDDDEETTKTSPTNRRSCASRTMSSRPGSGPV
jgi:hypothetical protein